MPCRCHFILLMLALVVFGACKPSRQSETASAPVEAEVADADESSADGDLACPAVRLPSGTCLVLPEDAGPELPAAIYLHGMTTQPSHAREEGLRLAALARGRMAVLMPLGPQGECAWSPDVEKHHCWPTAPDRAEAVEALVQGFQADLEEVRQRLGREKPISPFLVGFSNGAFGAVRIAATTEMPLAGVAVLHGGGDRFIQQTRAVPSLLIAAQGDEWHFATMQSLREKMAATEWPVMWKEREGGHRLADEDIEAVIEFILERSRERDGAQ